MTSLQEVRRVVQARLDQYQVAQKSQDAYLGDGNGTITDESQPFNTYVRFPHYNSPAASIPNIRVPAQINDLKVKVGYLPEQPSILQVLSVVPDQRLEGAANLSLVPTHANTHAYGGSDPVYVVWRQIGDFRLYATGGLQVTLQGGIATIAGTVTTISTQLVDLTDSVPTTGARWSLISIKSTGAVTVTDGTPQTTATALTFAHIPATPSGEWRIWAIKLQASQTVIDESRLFVDTLDLRWPQNVGAGSVALSDITAGSAQYQYLTTGASPYTAAWSSGYLNITAAKTLSATGTLTLTPSSDGLTLTVPANITALGRDANIAAGRLAFGSDANTLTGDAAILINDGGRRLKINNSLNSYDIAFEMNQTGTAPVSGTGYAGRFLANGAAIGYTNIGLFAYADNATGNKAIWIYGTPAGADNYAIFSDAAAKSYFAGAVGFGTTVPNYKVEVSTSVADSETGSSNIGFSYAPLPTAYVNTITNLFSASDAHAMNFNLTSQSITTTPLSLIRTGSVGAGTKMQASGVTYQRLNVNGSQLFVGADSSQESPMLQIVPSYVVNTHASYTTRTVFSQWDVGGAREIMRGESSGSAPLIGFLGANAIARYSSTGDLRQALIDFGLYTTGGASPLDLNGGRLTGFVSSLASTTASASIKIPAGTAPTSPVEGDQWNDSTQKADIAFIDGIKQSRVGCIFTQTADVTVASTASETTLIGTGVGTVTLPANFFTVGKTIRIGANGHYGTANPAGTLQIKVKLGTTVILDTTASTMSNGLSNLAWTIAETVITCRTTGATGTVMGQGYAEFSTTHTATTIDDFTPNTTAITIDTTASQAISITAQWGTSSASNTITATNVTIEVLN